MAQRVRAGIWIDRKEAIIVTLNGETSTVTRILSDVEPSPRQKSMSSRASSDKVREERRKNQLRRFFKAVIDDTRGATEIHILGPGEVITVEDLPPEVRFARASQARDTVSGCPFTLPEDGVNLEDVERGLLTQALERTGGNQSAAARLLGISRYALRYRMEKYSLTSSS